MAVDFSRIKGNWFIKEKHWRHHESAKAPISKKANQQTSIDLLENKRVGSVI